MTIRQGIAFWVFLFLAARSPAQDTEKIAPLRQQTELTDAEADAIVRARAAAVAEGKRQKLAKMAARRALSRRVVPKAGRRVVMERIEAPPASPPAPRTPAAGPTAAQLATSRRQAGKDHVLLSISATVYDREVTQIRWTDGDARRTAFSNIDFSLLRGVSTLESADTVFSFFMGIGEQERRDLDGAPEGAAANAFPQRGAFRQGAGSYFLAAGGAGALTEKGRQYLAGLDALHAYYRKNERALRVADGRRRALAAASARYRRANPPVPEDTVIQFWKKSGAANAAAGE